MRRLGTVNRGRWVGMLAVLAACLGMAGCAAGGASASGPSAGRSGIEVFGTIDAGVSGVVNKSGR